MSNTHSTSVDTVDVEEIVTALENERGGDFYMPCPKHVQLGLKFVFDTVLL